MQDLNKQQVILVTLLVSFVTSIATGTITVSMMHEAPQTFTQTVNRVVERTIERVVPDASVIKTIEPKIITIEDQVAGASEIGQESIVKILDKDGNTIGTGPIISKTGKTISSIVGTYLLYPDGQKYGAMVASSTSTFSILVPTTDKKFIPITLAKEMKPGKTVVLISEGDVYQGIVQNASTTSIQEKAGPGSFFLDLTGSLIGVNINSTLVPASAIAPFI